MSHGLNLVSIHRSPGSQAVNVASEGYLSFAQALSSSLPVGAITGSFAHFQPSYISKYAFGTRGFTACLVRAGAYETNQICTTFCPHHRTKRQCLFLHRLWRYHRGLSQHRGGGLGVHMRAFCVNRDGQVWVRVNLG
jgi:hypothetical protein